MLHPCRATLTVKTLTLVLRTAQPGPLKDGPQPDGMGWLADDLVVTCWASGGDRTTALFIKSAQQVTRAGFPQDFATIAWAQWFGIKTER